MKYRVILLLLGSMCLSWVHAQNADFCTWTKVKTNYEFAENWELITDLEFRSKDNVREADRVGLNLGVNYQAWPFLQLESSYEIHYRNREKGVWKFRHRYKLGAQASVKVKPWKFSLRERIQQTFSEGDLETRLRSRLKLDYAPERWKIQPYFSVEFYLPIGDAAFFQLARVRYRPGLNIDLSKSVSLDLFYCRQYESEQSKNIFGIELDVDL